MNVLFNEDKLLLDNSFRNRINIIDTNNYNELYNQYRYFKAI